MEDFVSLTLMLALIIKTQDKISTKKLKTYIQYITEVIGKSSMHYVLKIWGQHILEVGEI